MNRLRLYHAIAAGCGLLASAVVVVIVFGMADREGSSQEGEAPTVDTPATSSSGGIACADNPQRVAPAQAGLPPVFDDSGQLVNVTKGDQRAWFRRIQTQLHGCADGVTVYAGRVDVSASYDYSVSDSQLSKIAVGTLKLTFDQPLARNYTLLHVTRDGTERTAFVSRSVWNSLGKQPRSSIAGLQKARQTFHYGDAELRLSNW